VNIQNVQAALDFSYPGRFCGPDPISFPVDIQV